MRRLYLQRIEDKLEKENVNVLWKVVVLKNVFRDSKFMLIRLLMRVVVCLNIKFRNYHLANNNRNLNSQHTIKINVT